MNSAIRDLAEAIYDAAVAKAVVQQGAAAISYKPFSDLGPSQRLPFYSLAERVLANDFDLSAAGIQRAA